MKMDIVAGSGNDEFYTPEYAILPIIKYIPKNSTIWCPFDTDNSLFVKLFKKNGFNVEAKSLMENRNEINNKLIYEMEKSLEKTSKYICFN